MAPGLSLHAERRRTPRVCAEHTPWCDSAILRPGQEVRVINLSCGGALLESACRMSPGARAELQLIGAFRRLVRGRIDRCQVARLDPVWYRGAIVFEEHLEFAGPRAGSECSAAAVINRTRE